MKSLIIGDKNIKKLTPCDYYDISYNNDLDFKMIEMKGLKGNSQK